MILENIHVIIVCVNYCDFLKYSYTNNIKFFKKENYHIVTDKTDLETIELCEKQSISYRFFDFFNNSKINKSGAINMMQKELHQKFPNDWILLLDADILLPDKFDTYFLEKCDDKQALYSLKRKEYQTKEDFESKKNLKNYGGITFMGYMQLYYDKSKYYKTHSNDCGMCDTIFRDYFYSFLKLLDEDDYVIHLGYEILNCQGRITEKW